MPGTIHFMPKEANIYTTTPETSTIKPYYILKLGNRKVLGDISQEEGLHPHWDDDISLEITQPSICIFELKDSNKSPPNDIIGSCEINFNNVISQGKEAKRIPLNNGVENVGDLYFEANFVGKIDVSKKEETSLITPRVSIESTLELSNLSNERGSVSLNQESLLNDSIPNERENVEKPRSATQILGSNQTRVDEERWTYPVRSETTKRKPLNWSRTYLGSPFLSDPYLSLDDWSTIKTNRFYR